MFKDISLSNSTMEKFKEYQQTTSVSIQFKEVWLCSFECISLTTECCIGDCTMKHFIHIVCNASIIGP